jgi:hypothetical protein
LLATWIVLWPGNALAASNPVPNINGVSPASVAPGNADFVLTVNGSNFITTSVVFWNSTALVTTYVGRNQLTAVVPTALLVNPGPGWITVVNPGVPTSNLAFVSVTGSTPTLAFVQTDFTIAGGSQAVALGDFNGDGKLDIVTGGSAGPTISVLLGNGDGTFQPAITSPSPGQSGISVGDFNHDGLLDVAIVRQGANTVSILLGNGDGTFQAAHTYATTTIAYTVAVGDYNSDGKLDVAVANELAGGLTSIFLGIGDGTLQAPTTFMSGNDPYGVVVADFNGDGKPDLAVTNYGGSSLTIYLGNGTGGFTAQTPITIASSPLGLAVGDFNGDGKADLVVANQSGGLISILLGNGDGTFQTRTTFATFPTAFSVAIGDLNGDGNLDLAISGSNAKAISILLGNGDGTFQPQLTFGTGSFGWTVAMGDLDGSGRLGLAVADFSSGKLHILLQGVVLTPSPLIFASQGVGTTSSALTMTLTNATGSPVTPTGFTFSGANAADFSETDTCVGVAVPSAGTCPILVKFTPSIVGAETATLSVADNAHGSPQSATVTGTGIAAPIATFAPTGLIFTSQPVGVQTAVQTVTLTNTGNAIMTGIAVSITGTNAADFAQTNPCPATLAPTIGCTISVTFTPSLIGSESASLSVADNAPGNPQTVPLSGTGAQISPTVTWATPAAITYGTVLSANQLNATANVAGVFVYSPALGSTPAVGSQTLSTTFTPTNTAAYSTAMASVTLQVNGAPTTATLTTSANLVSPGTSVTFTAVVSSSAGVPGGSVTFLDGTTTLGAGALTAGSATFTTSTLAGGPHIITAVYLATGNFLGSTSAALTQTIGTPSFVLAPGTGAGVTSVSAAAGQPATFQLTITGVFGFTGLTTFSVTGLPTGAFAPPSLTLTSTPAVEVLTVTTTPRFPYVSQLIPVRLEPIRPPHLFAATIFALAGFVLAGFGLPKFKRRNWELRFALLGLFAVVGVLGGCGSTGNFQNTGTPAGTYSMVVTATSGAVQHSTTVTLVVQ